MIDVDDLINKLDDGTFSCLQCGYGSNRKFNVQCHVESKHVSTSGYTCPTCALVLRNRKILMHHVAKHKKDLSKLVSKLFMENFL